MIITVYWMITQRSELFTFVHITCATLC